MAFHEQRFPLRLSLTSSGGPGRQTDIVSLSNGREARNRRWRFSRRRYDVGTAVRSVSDLYAVLEFFEARGGQLHGFRFRDPVDGSSAPPGAAVTPLDQLLGTGDGETAAFQLVKAYGDGAAVEQSPSPPAMCRVRARRSGRALTMMCRCASTPTGSRSTSKPFAPGVFLPFR